MIAATHVPGTYEDFVRLVLPELQRRGLFHHDYEGETLRENLGLQRPLAQRKIAVSILQTKTMRGRSRPRIASFFSRIAFRR